MSSNHTDPAFCKEHYQKATGWSPWNHWYHHFPHAEWDIRHQIKLNHLRYVEIVGMLTGATLNHPFHHVRALIDKHIKNGLNLINPDTFLDEYPRFMPDDVIENLSDLNKKYVSLLDEYGLACYLRSDGKPQYIISRNGILRKRA